MRGEKIFDFEFLIKDKQGGIREIYRQGEIRICITLISSGQREIQQHCRCYNTYE